VSNRRSDTPRRRAIAGERRLHADVSRADRLDRPGGPQVQGHRRPLRGLGIRFTDIRWTLGAHDIVATVEATDDETLAAALLALAGQGNLRTTTLRAFTGEEMRNIIGKVA
jgi:uncharacterized protein with GYD domain